MVFLFTLVSGEFYIHKLVEQDWSDASARCVISDLLGRELTFWYVTAIPITITNGICADLSLKQMIKAIPELSVALTNWYIGKNLK